ncbi:hypothetical protein P170DRAFT_473959 [Aspergillus steynii IBT 23096]|uniref:Uncharacterized protein n=1 Tax=Aspergillus steynii IBT 23096 TaxID=1392250 RepID=A0A2I2GBZ2_9EURO|nr:uncharacterized protein P170DRAFT_473959 [Aspergillus steynii IBT 23096]PLB50402.1 hypothetical protein P170DRAFT_473959 [Aspergillus steynii IBT 23096]
MKLLLSLLLMLAVLSSTLTTRKDVEAPDDLILNATGNEIDMDLSVNTDADDLDGPANTLDARRKKPRPRAKTDGICDTKTDTDTGTCVAKLYGDKRWRSNSFRMKLSPPLILLLTLLSLVLALETQTETSSIKDIDYSLPSNISDPDFDDGQTSQPQTNNIEPRMCIGRCRSVTNDCVWKCEDWSRVVRPCHEYRPCTRDRRHCSVLANAPEWAICK